MYFEFTFKREITYARLKACLLHQDRGESEAIPFLATSLNACDTEVREL
jgi:hypothetical protein